MTNPISLQPRAHDSLKAALVGAGKSHPGLPADVLQDIGRRLQMLCLLLIVLSGLGLLMRPVFLRPAEHAAVLYAGPVAGILLSAAVLLVVRSGRVALDRLLLFGTAYAIVVAFVLAFSTTPATWFADTAPSRLRWSSVTLWIVLFPVVVPNATPRTFAAAAIAATAEPLAILFYHTLDFGPMPAAGSFIQMLWTNAIGVGIAVAVSRTLYRLGEQVTTARYLGSYHLIERLGAGGMGEVWRATHRLLARPAAVKLIHRDALGGADEATTRHLFLRFEREAQATAALCSPHTIGVYDFGIAQDGTFYYVMELLDGLDLHTLVARHGPQPPARVVRILRQACQSLAEAHARGLLHRDIKPANIFLCRYGLELDFVKLLDFGLVKEQRQEAKDLHLTHRDVIVGTPAYVAPEAITGDRPLDGRSDLYAIGCVAYWLLAGRDVFEKPNALSLFAAHLQEAPAPPSLVATQDIPDGLERIVLSLLAKDPNQRPADAATLAQQLEALGLDAGWTPVQAAEWWAHNRPLPAPSGPTAPPHENVPA